MSEELECYYHETCGNIVVMSEEEYDTRVRHSDPPICDDCEQELRAEEELSTQVQW